MKFAEAEPVATDAEPNQAAPDLITTPADAIDLSIVIPALNEGKNLARRARPDHVSARTSI
jgi:hypothetical protein